VQYLCCADWDLPGYIFDFHRMISIEYTLSEISERCPGKESFCKRGEGYYTDKNSKLLRRSPSSTTQEYPIAHRWAGVKSTVESFMHRGRKRPKHSRSSLKFTSGCVQWHWFQFTPPPLLANDHVYSTYWQYFYTLYGTRSCIYKVAWPPQDKTPRGEGSQPNKELPQSPFPGYYL
jgi:hypothetical protein